MHLLSLPDELLLAIAAAASPPDRHRHDKPALFALMRVCSRLRRVALDRALWCGAKLDLRHALIICHASPAVRGIELTSYEPESTKEFAREADLHGYELAQLAPCVERFTLGYPLPEEDDDEDLVDYTQPPHPVDDTTKAILAVVGRSLRSLAVRQARVDRLFLHSIATYTELRVLDLEMFLRREMGPRTVAKRIDAWLFLPHLESLELACYDARGEEIYIPIDPSDLPYRASSLRKCVAPFHLVENAAEGLYTRRRFPYLETPGFVVGDANLETLHFGDGSDIPNTINHLGYLMESRLHYTYSNLRHLALTCAIALWDTKILLPFKAHQTPALQELFLGFPHKHPYEYPLEWIEGLFAALPSLKQIENSSVDIALTTPPALPRDMTRTGLIPEGERERVPIAGHAHLVARFRFVADDSLCFFIVRA